MSPYTPEQRRADTLTPVVDDAFQARATHASHRARILGLGLSVGIAIALSGCKMDTPRPDPKGYLHALFVGNPNKREWECIGQCPPEVRKIEAAEDARNAR